MKKVTFLDVASTVLVVMMGLPRYLVVLLELREEEYQTRKVKIGIKILSFLQKMLSHLFPWEEILAMSMMHSGAELENNLDKTQFWVELALIKACLEEDEKEFQKFLELLANENNFKDEDMDTAKEYLGALIISKVEKREKREKKQNPLEELLRLLSQ